MESSQRFVRLETGSSGRKGRKKVPQSKDPTIKLAIRLNEAVNDALRTLIRYRGDLSAMAIEAISTVDLESAGLVTAEDTMVRDTTITLTKALHKKLKKLAQERNSSMNIMVNTALAHWLAQKGALKLR